MLGYILASLNHPYSLYTPNFTFSFKFRDPSKPLVSQLLALSSGTLYAATAVGDKFGGSCKYLRVPSATPAEKRKMLPRGRGKGKREEAGHRKERELGNVGPRKKFQMAENFVDDFKLSLICKKVYFLAYMISFIILEVQK